MLALYIIGGLFVLLIAVLSVPVDVRLRTVYPDTPGIGVSVRWLFGLVTVPVVPGKKSKNAVRKKPRERPGKQRKGMDFRVILEILRTKGLFGEIKRLVKALIHRLHVRDIAADIGVGMEDPADTGMLFAILGPAACLCPFAAGAVRVTPLPDVAAIQGEVNGTMRLWPISFVPPLAQFIFSVPVVRSLKTLLVNMWRNRHKA